MAHTKQHYPNYVGVGKPIKTTGYALSNAKGHCSSYGKNLTSGGSTDAWLEPVNVATGPVAHSRPVGGPKDGAHPNARVTGKGARNEQHTQRWRQGFNGRAGAIEKA
jgi:hypothetical protein